MQYVFISHASDDKFRLGPYVRHLLEHLDESVGIWIDAPHLIDPGLAIHPRVSAIQPGEDWLVRILTDLHNENCVVIGFWSANATSGRRPVFLKEVDVARQNRRYVPVCLDPLDQAKVPDPFNADHILDVSRFSTPTDTGAFDIALKNVVKLLKVRSQQVAIEEDRLPYLVDRQPQISRICNAVEGAAISRQQAATGPLCFIMPSHAHDVADMFLWRLTQKDGPEQCGYTNMHDHAGWVDELLEWPRATKPAQFQNDFAATNRLRMRRKLLEGMKRRRPICFFNKVLTAELNPKVPQYLDQWTSFWNSQFPAIEREAMANSSEDRQVVIALLVVVVEEQRGWFGLRNSMDACCREIETYKPNTKDVAHPGMPAATILPLERLSAVRMQDAEEWMMHRDIMRRGLDRYLRAYVPQMFAPRGKEGIRMQNFADNLFSADFGRHLPPKR